MDLKVYNSLNSLYRKHKPCIAIFGNHFRFSMLAVKLLSLGDGSRISVAQDKDRPKDFYVFRDANGFLLRFQKNSTCTFSSKKVASMLREALNTTDKSFSIPIATNPTEFNGQLYYAILTSQYEQA